MRGVRALQPVCGVLLVCLGLFPRGAAAQGVVPLALPPAHDVTVTPKGTSVGRIANTTGHSQTFTVNNDGTEQDAYDFTCLSTGPVTCTGLSRTTAIVAAGASVNVVASYNVGAIGNGTIKLRAFSDFGIADTGFVNVTVGGPPLPSVTPDGGTTANRLNNTSGHVETFVINNTGVTTTTYTITCSATGTVTCTGTQAASVVTAPGVGTSMQVTYSVGAAGPGTLVLTATNSFGSDNGSFNITSVAASPQPPDVDVAVVNPGATVERSLCLTVAMGEGAAAECGDLRIVHPLPTTKTMNKARTPTLLYNRAFASPFPIVAAQVTLPVTAAVPDSVTGKLSIGGTVRSQGKWTGSDWVRGKPRRIALAFDAVGDATGVYTYTFEVRNWYGSSSQPRSVTGPLAIVNRKASPFGAGWWLAGLEQYDPTTRMWVGGDGSVRVYAPATGLANVYVAPQLDRPDTLKWDGTNYVRLDKGGLRVKFDAAGRHVATINRQGHQTSFTHASGGLTITLPGQLVTPSYQFSYDLTAKRLASVTSPQISGTIQRVTTFAGTNGQITSITDPDGAIVRFAYSPTITHSIISRTDRRGTVTSFASHTSNKVPQSNTVLAGPTSIIIALTPVEIRGLPILGSVDTAQATSRLDGPRTDIFSDTTLFWHDRFGAPKKIVDPQGAVTTLERTDARFPALVTAVVHGNGWRLEATYDARGNVNARTDRGFANNPRTTYAWHQTWDELTAITRPMGDGITMAYDATTGNRLWQQDNRGISTRVTFGYDAFNRVDSITQPGTPSEVISYDPTIGNVETVKSPMKFDIQYTHDPVGQVTLVETRVDTLVNLPPSSGTAIYATLRSFFDRMGRDTLTISAGPSMGVTVPAETVYVRKRYNPNGQVDSSEQWSGPDPEGIGRIRTAWRYDPAGRQVTAIDSRGLKDSTVYDLASNPTRVITRRGHVINMTYDAMSRLLTRTLPAVSYTARPSNLLTQPAQANYPAYQIPAETHTFTYDSLGRIRTANNPNARVTRTYFPNGWLETETLAIQTLDRTSFTTHQYLTRYNYDRDGRRVSIQVPAQLAAPGTTGLMSFGYSTVFDAMISADDDLRAHYSFGYNNRGELASITYPSQYVQRFTYDADGRIAIDSILNNGTTTFPRLQTTRVRSIKYNYDARGRMLRSGDPNGFQDTLALAYSGMGYLISTKQTQRGQLLLGTSFSPARFVLTEAFRFDGLGNRHIGESRDTLKNSNGSLASSSVTTSSADYEPGTGRMTRDLRGITTTTFDYDQAGSIEFSSNPGSGTSHPGEERAMFYGADGTVRAVDWRFIQQPGSVIAPKKFAFEEYRYDALGRRVWMRSQKTCEDRGMGEWWEAAECKTSLIRRTVWDGEQELVEIQMPGGTAANEAALHENDTARVQLPSLSTAAGTADRNQYFGRVIYTPGRAVDQPLGVTRINYGFQHDDGGVSITYRVKAPFTTMPFWDVKGDAPIGVFTNGARLLCEPTGTLGICVGVVWPYFWSAYDRHRITVWDNWHGSLLERKRDKTGLEYKRQRYYDAQTGRFTQEDPIGLAGGMNLYGFADGDPVNFADPFGLAPCKKFLNCLLELARMEWRGFVAGSDPTGLTPFDPDQGHGQLGYGIGKASMVAAGAGRVGFGGAGAAGGRAPEFIGGSISESGFLRAAQSYLGEGYRVLPNGRYISKDGLRQVRYGAHEVRGRHHAHFEAYDRAGGRVIENTRVYIVPDL